MRIISGIRHLDVPLPAAVITIGNFDGMHLGHQALVSRLVAAAKARSLPSVAITFEPHPLKVLLPDRDLQRIFDPNDLKRQMAKLGVDALVIEPFSREFSRVLPERFVREWLHEPFHPHLAVVGYDFSFGANRQGSIDFLREQGGRLGFEVEVVAPVKVDGIVVSSTKIRQAVEVGDVAMAARMLGRRFYLEGLVGKGAGRGRTIGVPTANLRVTAELIPRTGVYAAAATVRGRRWPAAVNIGFNPTFQGPSFQSPAIQSPSAGASAPSPELGGASASRVPPARAGLSVEAHLIDFPEVGAGASTDTRPHIYGESLRLDFITRLRDEKKFAGAGELVAQIKSDVAEAARIFAQQGLVPGAAAGDAC